MTGLISIETLISNLNEQINGLAALDTNNNIQVKKINDRLFDFFTKIDSAYLPIENQEEIKMLNALFSKMHEIGHRKAKSLKLGYYPPNIVFGRRKGKKVKVKVLVAEGGTTTKTVPAPSTGTQQSSETAKSSTQNVESLRNILRQPTGETATNTSERAPHFLSDLASNSNLHFTSPEDKNQRIYGTAQAIETLLKPSEPKRSWRSEFPDPEPEEFPRMIALAEKRGDNMALVAVHNRYGSVLESQGNIKDAIDQYDTAIELNPKDSASHNNKGIALAKAGRNEDAIKEYDAAIELTPNNPMYHHNRGNALKEIGRHEEAIAEYDNSIDITLKDEGNAVTKSIKSYVNAVERTGKIDRLTEGGVVEFAKNLNPVAREAYFDSIAENSIPKEKHSVDSPFTNSSIEVLANVNIVGDEKLAKEVNSMTYEGAKDYFNKIFEANKYQQNLDENFKHVAANVNNQGNRLDKNPDSDSTDYATTHRYEFGESSGGRLL